MWFGQSCLCSGTWLHRAYTNPHSCPHINYLKTHHILSYPHSHVQHSITYIQLHIGIESWSLPYTHSNSNSNTNMLSHTQTKKLLINYKLHYTRTRILADQHLQAFSLVLVFLDSVLPTIDGKTPAIHLFNKKINKNPLLKLLIN